MKILDRSRHRYVARLNIFFITLAFITGMLGCVGNVVEYDLAIDNNTGGSVVTPGVGTFAYPRDTVVDLLAEPNSGYHFVEWTGDVSTIADLDNATTTLTLDNPCSITAIFAFGPLNRPMVAAGGYHTVGLEPSGGTVAAGYNSAGQCDVDGWTDIIQVAAGDGHTVGLQFDGTVIAAGANTSDQPRLGLVLSYVRSWLRPQDANLISVPIDVARGLAPRLRDLLGYAMRPPFHGYVDGRDPRLLFSDSVDSS